MSGVFGTFFKDLDFLGPTWNHLRVLIVVKTKYPNLGPIGTTEFGNSSLAYMYQ